MSMKSDLAKEIFSGLEEKFPETESFHRRGNIDIAQIDIKSDELSALLEKPKGRYITMEAESITDPSVGSDEEISALAEEIASLLPPKGTVLVAGIGNVELTADSLGARSADMVMAGTFLERRLCCLSTGVCGKTGFEAFDMIASAAAMTRPGAVILIDALAAEDISHIGRTVQITDTGIRPGSGIGSGKRELSEKTLGVPVIAIGVPTVIRFPFTGEKGKEVFVSPNDIDITVKRAARLIALAVNLAVFPGLGLETIKELVF